MSAHIITATHKPYTFPETGTLYTPIQVGRSISAPIPGLLGDDNGENISEKNRSFCELTALYWAWRNDFFKDVRFCGLVHYRRYFAGSMPFGKFHILEEEEIEAVMQEYDIIVPTKRKYYIETVRDHYAHAHHKRDLELLEKVLETYSPEYMQAYEDVMEQTSLHLYNMFIMREESFQSYAAWLFPLLFELEGQIDTSDYDPYQQRVFGFLAERLFNVWITHHKMKKKEVKIVNIEGENLLAKGLNMLKRKYFQ